MTIKPKDRNSLHLEINLDSLENLGLSLTKTGEVHLCFTNLPLSIFIKDKQTLFELTRLVGELKREEL